MFSRLKMKMWPLTEEYTASSRQLAFHEVFYFLAQRDKVLLFCTVLYLILLRRYCWMFVPINKVSHLLCKFVVCVKYRTLWLRDRRDLACARELYQSRTALWMLLQFPMIANLSRSVSHVFNAPLNVYFKSLLLSFSH